MDSVYERGIAVHCKKKGSSDVYVVKTLKRFALSLGFEKFHLQSDLEHSLADLAVKTAAETPGAMPRAIPEGSKGSNGRVERLHQSIQGMMRTLRLSILDDYGVQIPTAHPLTAWMMRHAAWLRERFQAGRRDGLTPYSRHRLRDYLGKVVPFGETVMWRQPGPVLFKLKGPWGFGIWLGRAQENDAHIVGTRHGCLTARAVRRLPPSDSERHDKQLLLAMQGSPGHMSGKADQVDVPIAATAAIEASASGAPAASSGGAPPATEAGSEGAQPVDAAGSAGAQPATEARLGEPEAVQTQEPVGTEERIELPPPPEDFTVEDFDAAPQTRPRGRPPKRVLPDPRGPDYTPLCSGCSGASYYHRPGCKFYQKKVKKTIPTDATELVTNPPVEVGQPAVGPTASSSTQQSPQADSSAGSSGTKRSAPENPENVEMETTEGTYGPSGDVVMALAVADEVFEIADTVETRVTDYWDEDGGEWLEPAKVHQGMKREGTLMNELDVAETVNRSSVPAGTRVWSGRWCHRKKADGVRSRYVIRQFKGEIDADAFSGTPGYEAARVLLAIASLTPLLDVITGDFSVAFLHTPLKEHGRVYVEPPRELEPDHSKVWYLKKALDGFKEASLRFQQFLFEILSLKLDFMQSVACPTLLYNKNSEVRIVVHVDDPLATGKNRETDLLFENLGKYLTVRVSPAMNSITSTIYLGCRYWRQGDTFVEAPAENYIKGIIEAAGVEDQQPVVSPGISESSKDEGESLAYVGAERRHTYRKVVGKAQFILPRRPDVMFALKELGRRLQEPREKDWRAMQRLARYLKGTANFALHLHVGEEKRYLATKGDSDWAGCHDTRRLTSCALVMWGNCLIHAHSRTQGAVTALSSPGAEYYGCVGAAAEALYVQHLIKDMGFETGIWLETDASSARAVALRQGLGKIRHLEVKYLWLQGKLVQKAFNIVKVKGTENAADLGIKHVETKILQRCCEELGLTSRPFLGGEANVVAALFARAMAVPQPSRFKVLRLLVTAATPASAKAHEDNLPSCVKEVAIGATLTRTDTWAGVLELRIDGIPILIITVILTVAITLVCVCWFQRRHPVFEPDGGHRTHTNKEQEKIRRSTGR